MFAHRRVVILKNTVLSVNDVVALVGRAVPYNRVAPVLRALPARVYDRETRRYRPVAVAMARALAMVFEVGEDADLERTVNEVELAWYDPALPKDAFIEFGGEALLLARLVHGVRAELEALELAANPPSSPKRSKKHTPVA
jgi:hypothetical protein